MKKRILLIAMLSSVSLSMYPAVVRIQNFTKEPVWVRINDKKRDTLQEPSWGDKLWGFFGKAPLAGAPGPSYPDFRKIEANSVRMFKTDILGIREIKKVTFIKVEKYKKITGTSRDLRNRVALFTHMYGLIQLRRWRKGLGSSAGGGIIVTEYINGFNEQKQQWETNMSMDATTKHTISVPEIDSFQYILRDKQIMPREKGIIDLKKWGDAVRTQ